MKFLFSFQILQSFAGAQLTELHICSWNSIWLELIDFLSTQTCLKRLDVVSMSIIPDNLELPQSLKCNVEVLHVFVLRIHRKFEQFLSLFTSLTHFGLACIDFPFEQLLPIIRRNSSLHSLLWRSSIAPKEDFYKIHQPKLEINKLYLGDVNFNTDAEIVGFFTMFPALGRLGLGSEVKFGRNVTGAALKRVFSEFMTTNVMDIKSCKMIKRQRRIRRRNFAGILSELFLCL